MVLCKALLAYTVTQTAKFPKKVTMQIPINSNEIARFLGDGGKSHKFEVKLVTVFSVKLYGYCAEYKLVPLLSFMISLLA